MVFGLGIVLNPAPHGATANLPMVRRPGVNAEIRSLVLRIRRLEVRADQHVLVRAGMVGAPDDLARVLVYGCQPAAHAHLAAAVPDQDFALYDEGRHRDGFALVDVGEFRMPEFLARVGVDRNGIAVERIQEDLAIVIAQPSRDHIAAGDASRSGVRLRRVGPDTSPVVASSAKTRFG